MADTLSERGERPIPRSRGESADIFERLGLRQRGFWRPALEPISSVLQTGTNLCQAFQELGGLYLAFARFLLWRADLLNSDYLMCLRGIRVNIPAMSRTHVIDTLRRQFGTEDHEVIRELAPGSYWNSISRCIYQSIYQGRRILVEIADAPVTTEEFAAFTKGIAKLDHPEIRRIVDDRVLQDFLHWLRAGESLAQERKYLEVLGRHIGETMVDYPVLIPELTTDSVLCWHWVEGEPAAVRVNSGDAKIVPAISVAILEQFCSLSMVDGELDLESMVITPGGRLAVRRIGRLISVPPSLVNAGLKYISAVLEESSSDTVQSLIQLTVGHRPQTLEQELLESLSNLEPDLKVNLWFPPSATHFEGYWRALSKLNIQRPLFVSCLHRNLIAAGYWTADAVAAGAPQTDPIAEAHWPVVGSLLRAQLSQMFNRDTATEWVVGSSLLAFGAMREINRLAQDFRENNLTVGVEMAGVSTDSRQTNRAVRRAALLGFMLIVLLATLRWGVHAQGGLALLYKAVAICALVSLFWLVSRIG